jgi:hypothetical protein
MVNLYGRWGVSPDDVEEFKLVANRSRLKVLAKKYGVCTGVICRWKKKYGCVRIPGKQTDREITWSVDKNTGCWNCLSHKLNKNGYPEGNRNKGRASIAKVIYEKNIMKLKKGNVIMHNCDNRACINPSHLMQGAQEDNLKDMWSKGRGAFGEKHGNSKLTVGEVREIRMLYRQGKSFSWIAKQFGVCVGTISPCCRRITWKHVG